MDRTDTIKKELIVLFDEMLVHGKEFKRKSYAGAIEDARERYRHTVDAIIQCFAASPIEEKAALTDELARVIPDHAYEKMQSVKKRSRERISVDYNMNMAVYVVPILNYSRQADCLALTERMVELWNEKGITNMNLMHSTYDDLAAGFEHRLCYITTAVCRSMGKPDDCYELQAFRNFRDSYLIKTPEGRSLVDEYYELAPGIVMLINMRQDAGEIYEKIYNEHLKPCLEFIEEGNNEACRRRYESMTRGLKEKYLYA